jgi:LysR family glycine cleavage system transcriptional activator
LLPDATGKDWSIWFESHGVDAAEAHYATQYGDDILTVKAAIEGQGLALLNDIYVKESLASRKLVRVLNTRWPTAFAYYAVALEETLERPSMSAFIKWLKKDLGEQ